MKRKILYELNGEGRKPLVKAIGEYVDVAPKYLGVPSCAYCIGKITVDREGAVIIPDTMAAEEVENMIRALKEKGFAPLNDQEKRSGGTQVSMPRAMFTDQGIKNLHKIVLAKEVLIGKAIGSAELEIIEKDESVIFPWFPETVDAEEIKYYTQFIEALSKMAINSQRITGGTVGTEVL